MPSTPFLFVPTFSWPAAPFGLLYTYAAGSTTPKTTFSDAAGLVPNINPVELDSLGSATVRLGTGSYKFVLLDQTNTVTLWEQDNYDSFYLTAAAVGLVLYPQTAAELAASVTPTLYNYPAGNVLRYGADNTGTTDSSTAIAAALLANPKGIFAPSGTYLCSQTFHVSSNQIVKGDGISTVFQYTSGAMTNFSGSSITAAVFTDFKISVIGGDGLSTYGGIYLLNSSYCTVERVSMAGFVWSGVWLDGASNHNTIHNNHFSGAQEKILNGLAAGTGADVSIYSSGGSGTAAPSFNKIINNDMRGGGGYGVQILDDFATLAAGLPFRNIVQGNRVGTHLAYGLLLYLPGNGSGSADTYNQFIGNQIKDISGQRGLDGVAGAAAQTTGAGIYVVGGGIGGTQVHSNNIQNCCINTMTRTLVPAGIGVGGCPTGLVPPSIVGNSIDSMTQGDGIQISGGPNNGLGGAYVADNVIAMPSNNAGAGPGGATMQGAGLSIICGAGGLDNLVIGPNSVIMLGAGPALFTSANSANLQNLTMTGGSYSVQSTGSGIAWQGNQVGGFTTTQLKVSGTRFRVSSGTADAVSINAIVNGDLSGVFGTSVGGRGLFLNGCTNIRISGGGEFNGSSTNVQTSGTCTNSFIDKSVNIGITTGATGSVVVNGGTGCNIEQNFSSVPTAGSWVIGDRAVHLGVTVGTAKGWSRVTSGSANVLTTDWITEGNL